MVLCLISSKRNSTSPKPVCLRPPPPLPTSTNPLTNSPSNLPPRRRNLLPARPQPHQTPRIYAGLSRGPQCRDVVFFKVGVGCAACVGGGAVAESVFVEGEEELGVVVGAGYDAYGEFWGEGSDG